MKCHYEILGVARDASSEDLKRAYRKLALRWHPDKNPDSLDESTAQFRQIQQAYDVLSDSQERAWYDKHREAILRGGLGHGDNYEDNCFDVFQYFNSACYEGFEDDNKSFYSVFRDVFKKISDEDYEFRDDDSETELPDFGKSDSSYEEIVKQFYDHWETYCTAKSYVWVEKYDTREAPDRRIRRLMEGENKKLRDAAKKERNEEVRALVAFVKKRDRRVKAYKKFLEERAAEIERKGKEHTDRQRQTRLKMMDSYQETKWSAMTGLEKDLQKLEDELSETFGETAFDDGVEQEEVEEEEYIDQLFCVACGKAFKSERALANHEKSRKHKENIMLLKSEMEEDDLSINPLGNNRYSDEENSSSDDTDTASKTKPKLSKKQKKKRRQQKLEAENEGSDPMEDLNDSIQDASLQDHSIDCSDKMDKENTSEYGTVSVKENGVHVCDASKADNLATGVDLGDDTRVDLGDDTRVDLGDDTRVDLGEDTHVDLGEDTRVDLGEDARVDLGEDVRVDLGEDTQISNMEQTAPNQALEQRLSGDIEENKSENAAKFVKSSKKEIHRCNVCGKNFQTRNKLFGHIKAEGHAVSLEPSNIEGKSRKKKGKQKEK